MEGKYVVLVCFAALVDVMGECNKTSTNNTNVMVPRSRWWIINLFQTSGCRRCVVLPPTDIADLHVTQVNTGHGIRCRTGIHFGFYRLTKTK